MDLKPTEEKLLHCLENVSPESIWGMAIHKALKEPTEQKFYDLVEQLQSQERDNPAVMKEILNTPCYEALKEFKR